MGHPADPIVVLLRDGSSSRHPRELELAQRLSTNDRYVVLFDSDDRLDGLADFTSRSPVHLIASGETVPRLLTPGRASDLVTDAARSPVHLIASAEAGPRLLTHSEQSDTQSVEVASITLIDPPAFPAEGRLEANAPTLIVHDRTLSSTANARAWADRIPGARCLPCVPVDDARRLDVLIPAVLGIGVDLAHQRARFRADAATDPLGWFERLYAEAAVGHAQVPWELGVEDPLLRDWTTRQRVDGSGRTAAVVGCGLGRDAEFVTGLGFDTTAFDISESAIRLARQRSPCSTVHYTVADLLDPPSSWLRAYDLVVECITVQALPEPSRSVAIRNVARLVAPGGTLLVIGLRAAGPGQQELPGPPWPLARTDVEAFASDGVRTVRIEELVDVSYSGRRERWRAEFRRPATGDRPIDRPPTLVPSAQ